MPIALLSEFFIIALLNLFFCFYLLALSIKLKNCLQSINICSKIARTARTEQGQIIEKSLSV